MRRGPVVGNVLSITSSYLLMRSVTKFLNKRLPKNTNYPWWKKEVTKTEISVPSSLQTSPPDSGIVPISSLLVNKDVKNTVSYRNINVNNELRQLNDTESQLFMPIFETWNKWMDKRFNTFLLYLVILFCLLYLPLYDLYEYKMMKRRRNNLCDKNRTDVLETANHLNNDLISSAGQNTSISSESESLDSNVVKNSNDDDDDDALECKNILDTVEGGTEHKKLGNSQQDKDDVTVTKNLFNYTGTPSLVSSSELSHSPKHDHVSLNLPYGSDQSNQTSQSSTVLSASSFIQLSPSKATHLNAQVDTRNAYSQPFKFK